MKNVMKTAWEIARKGQDKFGGKVSEYLSEAMKIAWTFHKSAGSDAQLLKRIKNHLVAQWKEHKEALMPTFGTCAVYMKIAIEQKMNFYMLDTATKAKIGEALAKVGY